MRASVAVWLLLAFTLALVSASTEGSVWEREADREILFEAARRAGTSPDQALLSLQRYVEDRGLQPGSPARGRAQGLPAVEQTHKASPSTSMKGRQMLDSNLDLDMLLQWSGFHVHAQHEQVGAGPPDGNVGLNRANNERRPGR
jgi:hypothetical protein